MVETITVLVWRVLQMVCEDYRRGLPKASTRALFVEYLNGRLEGLGLSITVSHLRELEKGRRTPSLELALGIERVTGGVVSAREWPGLNPKVRF